MRVQDEIIARHHEERLVPAERTHAQINLVLLFLLLSPGSDTTKAECAGTTLKHPEALALASDVLKTDPTLGILVCSCPSRPPVLSGLRPACCGGRQWKQWRSAVGLTRTMQVLPVSTQLASEVPIWWRQHCRIAVQLSNVNYMQVTAGQESPKLQDPFRKNLHTVRAPLFSAALTARNAGLELPVGCMSFCQYLRISTSLKGQNTSHGAVGKYKADHHRGQRVPPQARVAAPLVRETPEMRLQVLYQACSAPLDEHVHTGKQYQTHNYLWHKIGK
eukprot:CAMPEP_0179187156 /NCGR_PEP_ID=MMETSP0796-20121207/92859_1 /TAXON_ID=73915 /ORGANISM="Pyrodinium bahamense, Strain pbaha01" /LENGTH=275 /DNA_ID=CAMNT_0020891207 /DNA_START=424 /DNA_END=1249 /DNA_ORIENTATION=-